MSDSRESWRGSRRDFPKKFGLQLAENAAITGIGLGVVISTAAVVFTIDSAIDQLHHNAAVRNAENLAKLQDEFADSPRTQLSFLGEFQKLDSVQPLEINAFFTVPDNTPKEDAYKKTVYIVSDEDYQELPDNGARHDRLVFLDFADDVSFFEDFDYDYTAQSVQGVFAEHDLDPSLASKQVLAITFSVGSDGGGMEAIDTLLLGGFNILYAEGTASFGNGNTLGGARIEDGTQRVYTVPQFTY